MLKSFLCRIFCLKTVSCWKPSEGAELSWFILSSIKIFLKINRVSGAQWRISSLLFEFRFQPNAGVYAPGHSFIRFKKKQKKTIKLWTKSLYKWGFHIIIMSLSWTHTLLSCMHVTWNENNSVEACTSILTYLQWCNRKGYFHSLSTHHADGKLGEVSKSKRYFKAGIFTAKLKALACTSSGGSARARPGVKGVNNIFSK